MKKFFAMILSLCLVISLSACAPTLSDEELQAAVEQGFAELNKTINSQDIVAVGLSFDTDKENTKWLMTDIKNNTADDIDISEFTVAFFAWDANGQPICIKTKSFPDNSSYLFEAAIKTGSVFIPKGKTWAATKGLPLSDGCEDIAYIQGIAVSGTINGTTWENPYYDAWCETYNNQPLYDLQMRIMTCYSSDSTNSTDDKNNTMSFAEFYDCLFNEEMLAVNPTVSSYAPDKALLTTDIKNTISREATEICIAFAIWDKDGNPLIIESSSGLTENFYIKEAQIKDLTIKGKTTWVADIGMAIANEYSTVSHVEAIVVSCKLNGSEWSNSMYKMWKEFFGGKTLEKEMSDVINSHNQ